MSEPTVGDIHDAVARMPRAMVDVLVQHAPHRGGYGDFVVACDCGERGFARDADGNLRKDGESERAWAEHVAEALARTQAPSGPAAAHKPFTDDGVTYCGWAGDGGIVDGCGETWPCSTVEHDQRD